MKHLKEYKIFEQKKYTHGLYEKKDYVKLLDKKWTEISIDKKTRTIEFDVENDLDSDGKDNDYTYQVYYENNGAITDIMIQDAETFINKLDKEISINPSSLENIHNIICLPNLNDYRNMSKYQI